MSTSMWPDAKVSCGLAGRLWVVALVILALFSPAPAVADGNRIALFIHHHSPFWDNFVAHTQAAAQDLGVSLEVHNAQNSRETMLRQVREACRSGVDAILFFNYEGLGESILQVAEETKTPAFLVNTPLDDLGLMPRERYPHWIGSIVPDDQVAGELLAQRLLDAASKKGISRFNLLALTGREASRAHQRRVAGLHKLVDRRKDLTVVAQFPAATDEAAARAWLKRTLLGHPEVNLVWSISDQMALAAAQAARELGVQDRLVIGGIDWNAAPLQAVADGTLQMDVGGHVFDGAIAVVLVHDYLNGKDFANEHVTFHSSMLSLDASNIDAFSRLLRNSTKANFRLLSKTHNPSRLTYDFSLSALAESITPEIDLDATLTPTEREWLESHKRIRVGAMNAWPPFNYVDETGEPKGIGADLLKLLNQRLGNRLEIHPGPWSQIYDDVSQRRLDVLMDVTPKPSREPLFNFTSPYLNIPHVIVARTDTPFIRNENDLADKVLALESGFGNNEHFRQNFPQIQIRNYENTSAALGAVARGEADAYAGNRAVATYLITREIMHNLRVHGRLNKPGSILALGVRKDWPILRDILQKALDTIPARQMQAILLHWTGDSTQLDAGETRAVAPVALTETQRAWLAQHSFIRLGVDPEWPPFEFFDSQGRYRGMSADFMNRFASQVGITLTTPQRVPWREVLEAARDRRVDVLPLLVPSETRSQYLSFTKPYVSFPFVVFTRADASLITGLKDLRNRRVAVERGYISGEYIARDYPDIELVEMDTTRDALFALSRGSVDAYVGNLAVTSHMIASEGLTDLKLAAPTPYTSTLAIGVRKDWPELVAVLNQAIDTLTATDVDRIRQKWLAVTPQPRVDYTLVLQVIGIGVIIFGLGFLWHMQVRRRSLALAVSEERFDAAMRAVSEAVWEWDLETDARYFSPGFFLTIGYSESEVPTNTAQWVQMIHPDEREAFMQQVTEHSRNSEKGDAPLVFAYRIHKKDGGYVTVETRGSVVEWSDEGKALRRRGTLRDISAHKAYEDALKQAREEAERANQFKSSFLANMSHEIRTPMNAVVGFSHLALQSELNPQQRGYIEKIQDAAQTLLGVLNDILDVSRIEAGKLEVHSEPFALDEVLRRLAGLTMLKAEEKGLEIIFQRDLELPNYLLGDAMRLQQVLTNLVGNAVKFTEQGEIVVQVAVERHEDNRIWIRFSVSDTGIGMAAEDVPRLFDAFTQYDASTTRKHGGSGLGLSICRDLVHLMGGEIHVESEVGAGTRFSFVLPMEIVDEEGESETYRLTPDLRGTHALVVDDNAHAREILAGLLSAFTFKVQTAADATRAWKILEEADASEDPVRLVLMDWRMPLIDGVNAVRHIKQDMKLRTAPAILMVSAYPTDESHDEFRTLGLQGFLRKPVSPSELFDAAVSAVSGKVYPEGGGP